MNHTAAATGTVVMVREKSLPRSPRNGWQSDDSVILCGRLLQLSQNLRSALTSLRETISEGSSGPPPPSRESWESQDTTVVVSY